MASSINAGSPNREWPTAPSAMNIIEFSSTSSFRSHPRFGDYAGMGDPTKSRVFAVLQLTPNAYLSDDTINNLLHNV
jgi:hypothetical protein